MGKYPKHKEADIKETEAKVAEEVKETPSETAEELKGEIAEIDKATSPVTATAENKSHTIGEYAEGVISNKSGNELKLFIGLFPEEIKEMLEKHSDIDSGGKSNDLKVWMGAKLGFTPIVQERAYLAKEVKALGINPRELVQSLKSNPEISKAIKELLAKQSE